MLSAPDVLSRLITHEIGRHGEEPRSLVNTASELADGRTLYPVLFRTASVPTATTSTVAAARQTIGSIRFRGAAAGITPRGALSSAVRIREDAAMKPRASATAA